MGTLILNGNRGKMIMNGVVYGNDIEEGGPNLADIFNHGDVVGLNPYYKLQVGGTSGITVTDEKITMSKSSGYQNYIFSQLLEKSKFSKLCFDVEVPNTSDNYKDVVIGIRAQSRGIPPQNYEYGMPSPYVQLISWYERRNYSGTSPWYALPRITIQFDISSLSENQYWIEIYRHYGDLIIYSMWLEE